MYFDTSKLSRYYIFNDHNEDCLLYTSELTARVDALLRRMGENTPATHTGELYQPPFLLNLTNRTLEKTASASS